MQLPEGQKVGLPLVSLPQVDHANVDVRTLGRGVAASEHDADLKILHLFDDDDDDMTQQSIKLEKILSFCSFVTFTGLGSCTIKLILKYIFLYFPKK